MNTATAIAAGTESVVVYGIPAAPAATTAGAVNTIAASQADRTTVHPAIAAAITANAIVVGCRGTTTAAAAVAHRRAADRTSQPSSAIARLACTNRVISGSSRTATTTATPLVASSSTIALP